MPSSICRSERPRLRPGIELVPVSDDRALLRSASGTLLLSGDFVASSVPGLLSRLDGRTSLSELRASLAPASRPEFEELVQLLFEHGLFERPGQTVPDDAAHAINPHERAYWCLQGSDPAEAQARLADTTIAIVGLGGVGSALLAALVSSGVGRFILVDAGDVDSADTLHGYSSADIGMPRVEVAATRLRARGCEVKGICVSGVDRADDWETLVSTASLVVHCSDDMSLGGYGRTDEAARRSGTPWVSVRIDRDTGVYGPFVVPEQTACFTCYELRSRANAAYPGDHEALYRHWRRERACPSDWPLLGPIAAMLGNHVAVDLLHHLAGRRLSTVRGRVQHISLASMESRYHEVLKLPRCPACSRTRKRPMTKIWDLGQDRHAEPA